MNATLKFQHVLEREFGITLRSGADQTVSSPFRRDSNASFRCYYHPDEDDFDAFDWGSGKFYTSISLIMEAKNFRSFQEVADYAKSDYGVSISKREFEEDNTFKEKFLVVIKSDFYKNDLSKFNIKSIETAILHGLKGNNQFIDDMTNNIHEI